MSSLTVKDLIECGKERLELTLVAGEAGVGRELTNLTVEIFSFDSSGIHNNVKPGGMLLISADGCSRLTEATQDVRQKLFDTILLSNISLLILSRVSSVPDFVVEFSNGASIPLATSEHDVFRLKSRIIGLLREKVDHIVTINGVFVEVFGIGVVITGASGIGKSECGLELVTRGHKLIADDIVEIQNRGSNILYGRSTDLTRHFMEIRGLGVINVKSLFGVAAISDETDLRIMVEFVKWHEGAEFDRIESEEQFRTIMGVHIPLIRVPVRSGGSMATIVEIVARNEILKRDNYRADKDLREKVFDMIKRGERRKGKD